LQPFLFCQIAAGFPAVRVRINNQSYFLLKETTVQEKADSEKQDGHYEQ